MKLVRNGDRSPLRGCQTAFVVLAGLLFASCDGGPSAPAADPARPANLSDIDVANTMNETAGAQVPFTQQGCMDRNFPNNPVPAVPKEIHFFCAAPWNGESFTAVRRALENANVDLAGMPGRMSADHRSRLAGLLMPGAVDLADSGPPGLGAAYRVYYLLPLLWAIETGVQGEALSSLSPQDVAALTAAEASIDWDAPALEDGQHAPGTLRLPNDPRLRDVVPVILASEG